MQNHASFGGRKWRHPERNVSKKTGSLPAESAVRYDDLMTGIKTEGTRPSIYRQTVDLLLASMFTGWSDGRIQKFLFGKPGAADWDKRLGTEVRYGRKELMAVALFVREKGPKFVAALPVGEIESRLMHFISENYWYLADEALFRQFECAYGDIISEGPRVALTRAIEHSEIFKEPVILTIYPIVPVRVESDFDGGSFFLIAPLSLKGMLTPNIHEGHVLPTQFPPLASHKGLFESPASWLGTRAASPEASRKIKAAVLGALALTPHPMERYQFTGRKVFGGECTIGDRWSYSFGKSHTPPLSEDIVLPAADHVWLDMLAKKFSSDAKEDKKHLYALEYYYRAWGQESSARFPILFMALDSIYGDASQATQSVIEAVGPVMGSEYTYDRLRTLLSLRASVIHGGAPEIHESKSYHRYYSTFQANPISDLELIAAYCLQTVIFKGALKERPHTYAELIKKTTGRVV